MSTMIQAVPLHLAGNTTSEQNEQLRLAMSSAMETALLEALKMVDMQGAYSILGNERFLRNDLAEAATALLIKHASSDKFLDEHVSSTRVYPPTYTLRPVEAQVTELRKLFPELKVCREKIARRPLPEGAEGWFAIPRWQSLAPTYNEAVEKMLAVLASKRRFQNRILNRLGAEYLRQRERNKLAEKVLAEQQEGSDIYVVAFQFGMRHRGCSARRARSRMFGNEFGAGVFQVASALLTHPERLSSEATLMIDCGGDEYSINADYHWDRVPLFDFDISGIEISIFYEDRSRELWGMPSGFLFKME